VTETARSRRDFGQILVGRNVVTDSVPNMRRLHNWPEWHGPLNVEGRDAASAR